MVPAGYKRSLNVSIDLADEDQRLMGYKTLNLLNGSGDESMMSTVLYSHVAQSLGVPAPKANFVRVVINGENWGIYTNVQQFNKEFLQENFGTDKGARWKVSGSPHGGGGLEYRGPEPEKYEYPYERKSGGKEATAKLIEFCRVLNETPIDELPQALEPLVDIDELLWFLALDNGLINSDGYWVRASDYSIYLDDRNKFHFIPHDMNEAFRGAGGPGGRGPGGRGPGGPRGDRRGPDGRGLGGPGGPGGEPGNGPVPDAQAIQPRDEQGLRGREPQAPGERGMPRSSPLELDPLVGMDDPSKPLRSRVLAVPQYRAKYLANIRKLAEKGMDWNEVGPFIEQQTALIGEGIRTETRKLGSYEAFIAATDATVAPAAQPEQGQRGGHGSMNLRTFFEGRRAYLLKMSAGAKE
jgi:spore coat protein CotH